MNNCECDHCDCFWDDDEQCCFCSENPDDFDWDSLEDDDDLFTMDDIDEALEAEDEDEELEWEID
jgi:hypothetical protein